MVKAKKNGSQQFASTHDEFIASLTPAQKRTYDKEYRDHLLSELVLAIMKNDEDSIRELAKGAKVSSAIVQKIKSGTRKDITLQSFLKITKALGCEVFLEKGEERVTLKPRPKARSKVKASVAQKIPSTRQQSVSIGIHAKSSRK